MRLTSILCLLALLIPDCAFAQGAVRKCFTRPERQAEQMVREGLRLREGAAGCDRPPFYAQTWPLWEDINRTFGQRFAQQTQVRQRAFQREFGKTTENRLMMWDGRIVTYYRNYPLSPLYCSSLHDMLQSMQRKGWTVFTKWAKASADEVEMDYEPCEK